MEGVGRVLARHGALHRHLWRARMARRLGADETTAPWSARSFRALHVQRISVALQLAAAEEILDTILLDRSAAAMRGEATC